MRPGQYVCEACKEPIEAGQLYLVAWRREEGEFSTQRQTFVHHQCPIHVIVETGPEDPPKRPVVTLDSVLKPWTGNEEGP